MAAPFATCGNRALTVGSPYTAAGSRQEGPLPGQEACGGPADRRHRREVLTAPSDSGRVGCPSLNADQEP